MLVNLSFLSPQPSGISVYAKNLCAHLSSSLDSTLLISQSELDSFPKHAVDRFKHHIISEKMTPVYRTKGHLHRLAWTQWQLPNIYHHLKSDLLFSPIAEAPINTKCRYIVTIHDTIPLRFPSFSSSLTHYYRFWVPLVLNQAEHIICNSQATARDISSFFKIPAAKITPILLAYDHLHFYPLEEDRDRLNQPPYFLYVGRHDRYKNLHRLISAFSIFQNQIPNRQDYQLWIAGISDRRYTPHLQAQVRELEISHLVKFLDYVTYNELPNLIRGAIALVFPSLWEGFGLPVLEAMACGTPVISSNLSSLPEVIGDAGISIDPYNVKAIADAMQAVEESANLRSELKQLGLLRAKKFRWQATAQLTTEVLSKFI